MADRCKDPKNFMRMLPDATNVQKYHVCYFGQYTDTKSCPNLLEFCESLQVCFLKKA